MAKPIRFTQELVDEYISKGYWDPVITPSQFWDRNAELFPDKEAVVDSTTRLTWAQAKQWIDRLALGFVELGIQRDEMIVIQLPTCAELFVLRVAMEKAGILCLPVTRTLRTKEMEYLLGRVKAVGVIVTWQFRDFNYFDMVQELRPNLPSLRHVFISGDRVPEGTISTKEMVQRPLEEKYPSDYLESRKFKVGEVSWVAHTTGTTGFPKLVANTPGNRICYGKAIGEWTRLTGEDVVTAFSPVPAGANIVAYYAAPLYGCKSVALERFEAEDALKAIERERVTVLGVVPTQLSLIVNHPNFDKYDVSSLRFVWMGGSPPIYEESLKAEEKLKCPVVNLISSVDTGVFCASPIDAPRDVRLLTVGRPWGWGKFKLIGDDGNEVPLGEIGEMAVSAPHAHDGYYDDPEATWQTWSRDGWARIGDLCKVDQDGNLVVVGRKKDMIIRGAYNIYPVEVEGMIASHPKVANVAVVGMPDKLMVERVCAYVVPRPGQEFTFDEMVSFLKEQGITTYKIPERLEIIDSLPMVAEGQKVDKKALREDINAKLKAEGKI